MIDEQIIVSHNADFLSARIPTLTSVVDRQFARFRCQMLKHPAPFSGGKGADGDLLIGMVFSQRMRQASSLHQFTWSKAKLSTIDYHFNM
ncbi:MAG: hypothetical protein H0X30_33350 [Anaerolineae bacterium]|nr:hypothetical protein [Anaerolineae bacterium]